MNEKKPFSRILGQIVGGAIITSVSVCVIAVLVALTTKFLLWIF